MINRELLKQAQEQRNEEQRKAEQARIDSFQRQKQDHLTNMCALMSKLGVEVSPDDMLYTKDSYPFAINIPVLFRVGDMLTGYPFRITYQSDGMYHIEVDKQYMRVPVAYATKQPSASESQLYLAQFADMLDEYDKTRAEALEQFKAEFPKPAEPAQDETLDDLAAEVDEAFRELNESTVYESPILLDLVENTQNAWREFSKRALAAPATPTRHPDFEEWYQTLEDGEDVEFGYTTVYLNPEREALLTTKSAIVRGMIRYSSEDAKKVIAELQQAVNLAEAWNKDAEANNDGIGWNDHHEGK